MSQSFTSSGQSIGVSASASVLPMNIQDWFSLGLTGWISLQSKGLSRVFFNTTVQKHEFCSVQLSLWSNSHIHTWLLQSFDYINFISKVMSLLFNSCLGWLVIAFLPRSKHLLISWLQCLSAEELMLLSCGVGEDTRESLGLQGDPTSLSKRK